MGNVFDALKAQTFDQIATTMGYDAECRGMNARVLFNWPSVDEKVGDHEYNYDRPTLEFKTGDWPGIRESIEAKEDVLITMNGKQYYALKISTTAAKDGDVYKVFLQEV